MSVRHAHTDEARSHEHTQTDMETTHTETQGELNVPTWAGLLPLYLMAYENGAHKGRAAALSELERMAKLADLYVAARKEGAL